MRAFDLAGLALVFGGEYVLGAKDLHTDTCYMIYGVLQGGETNRFICPGKGHEEILCAVQGQLTIRTGGKEIALEKGHAVHLANDESAFLSNPSAEPVIYMMAGGVRR